MTDLLEMVQNWAYDPYITCDTAKCGQCLKEQIRSEVCKMYLRTRTEVLTGDLKDILDETTRMWENTSLYKRVRGELDKGKTLKQIEAELQLEGINL